MTIRNQVQLIGHVGGTPEIRELENDSVFVKFSLATNESYKNSQGLWVNNTEWHQVVAWGNTARRIFQLVDKGSELALQGKLTTRSWVDSEGNKRYNTEVSLKEFTLLGSKKESA